MSDHKCPECGTLMRPRQSGFYGCPDCGKLEIIPTAAAVPDPADVGGAGVADLDPAALADLTMDEVEAFKMPDFTEVEVGWRAWSLQGNPARGEVPVLQSVTKREQYWMPREAKRAECLASGHPADMRLPVEGCRCGFYATRTLDQLLTETNYHHVAAKDGITVIGCVSLWGKVIPGSQGWRAEIAYPRELFLPYENWDRATELAEAYGVPVRLRNILHEYEKEV